MSRRPVTRINFRFSADGRRAACLATDGVRAHLEEWLLTGQGPRRRLRVRITGNLAHSYPLPVAGDQVLLVERRERRQYLALVGAAGVLAFRPVPELWVNPAPPGHGLALGLAATPGGATEVFRIEADLDAPGETWRTLVAGVPGTLYGPGVVAGDRVVFHLRGSGGAVPEVLDPAAGEIAPLPLPPVVRAAVPVQAAGDRVLLGVTAASHGHRLAIAPLSQPGGLDLLDGLDGLDGSVRPLALDPTGTELAVRLRTGIRSRLLRYRTATRQLREITAPPGTAATRAAWPDRGLWLPYTTTTAPSALWWLPPGGTGLRSSPGVVGTGRPARVETLPGPAGPIEAVCYGDRRTSDRVVLALHGGPAAHWALAFDPALQAFAAAGLAVVAPNQRGSSGYGRAYQEAITGAWGGPDLADVLAVAADLARVRGDRRARPGLYGTSYGAFLGLLAMAAAPQLFSGCVAVAPFLSGARLYADAAAPVRALIDRLDGTAEGPAGTGPPDLLRQAPRIRGRVLVLHGDRDATIPVSHSRTLVAALAGRPGVAVRYRELPGRDHDPVRPTRHAPEFAEIVEFLHGAAAGVRVPG